MNISHRILSGAVALCIAAAYGCTDNTEYDFEKSVDNARQQLIENQQGSAPIALFDPTRGVLPFPSSLLFTGSQDGTINAPLGDTDPGDLSSAQVSLNALDGFSTTAAITAQLTAAVDRNTVAVGQSVRVFEVQTDPASGAVAQVIAELDQSQATAVASGNSVVVLPVVPLKESTDYMVILTNSIRNTSGEALRPSTSFSLASSDVALTGSAAGLEPVRQLTNAMLGAAVPRGVDPATVVLAWNFKTQSITPVMRAVKATTVAQPINIVASGINTNDANSASPGLADLYIGSLELPYYRRAPSGPNDVVGINSHWQGPGDSNLTRDNTTPIVRSIETVPVLMSVPNAASGTTVPAEGWPIAIFVHGITSSRLAMVAIADTMAAAGIAVIAIDLPMHGIDDQTNILAAASSPFGVRERTFGIDLLNNETGAPGPDGVADTSGSHFSTPQFLLAGRDNLRQSVADLLVLSESLVNVSSVKLNLSRKTVIGHSLGGTVATPFVALDDSISAVSLGMPAAGLTETNLASQVFGPPNRAALAAAGAPEGSPELAAFRVTAQTVIDSGDAINFGALAASTTPVHMIMVIDEITVPNSVPGFPLAGTEALARVMGLPTASQTTTESAIVKFTEGNHSSLLIRSSAEDAATTEMQGQVAAFAASSGAVIQITNPQVIQ